MSDQTLPEADGLVETRRTVSRWTFWFLNLVTHRWAGLVSFVWLMVLGLTGFIVDHPEWRWTQQWTVTSNFASDHIIEDQVLGGIVRKFHVNPDNPREMMGGSQRGLWRSSDGGATWQDVSFGDAAGTPMITAIVPSASAPWGQIWLGTDDGVWSVAGGTGVAQRMGLDGEYVSGLDLGFKQNELIGVTDRTHIFRLKTDVPDQVTWIRPQSVDREGLPEDISLGRFLVDLHFGKGLTGGRLGMWINDFGGLVIVVLSLTGLFYWLFPRRWRKPEVKAKWPKQTRRATLQWLFRFHGPILGIAAIIPIVYLSVTGIFVGHAASLVPPSVNIKMDRALTPGDYDLGALNWQFDAIAAIPGDTPRLVALSRIGLLQSDDMGRTWSVDNSTPLHINMKHINPGFTHRDGLTFVGAHGGPNYVRADGSDAWQSVPGLRMMVMDAVKVGDEWILKGSRGFSRWVPATDTVEKLPIESPPLAGMPFNRFMLDLHGGMMISHQFVWVNDLACIVAILLCITGFLAWWRKKWI